MYLDLEEPSEEDDDVRSLPPPPPPEADEKDLSLVPLGLATRISTIETKL